jgi:hypothetical protein
VTPGIRERLAVLPGEGYEGSPSPSAPEGILTSLDRSGCRGVVHRGCDCRGNLEHLPGADATVWALLRGTRQLRILATSRAPLRVAGEQRFPVPPLDVPAPGDTDVQRMAASPPIRLLVNRARAVDRAFSGSPANAATLVEVVRRLDGLLLVSWVPSVPVRGMVEQPARRHTRKRGPRPPLPASR